MTQADFKHRWRPEGMSTSAPLAYESVARVGGSREPTNHVQKEFDAVALHGNIRDQNANAAQPSGSITIALLTGGGDKPYALGLATALTSQGVLLDFIGSDDLSVPQLLNDPRITFRNLRGDQRANAGLVRKIARVGIYYWRLVSYAATAKPRVFHILWNNKFQLFDRTLLMLYYGALGKKVILTAHNVNSGKRDLNDSRLNRFSLNIQYVLSDHIFVHSESMKSELVADFDVADDKVTVIPFGINNTVQNTALSTAAAKEKLGLCVDEKSILFFGNIARYKGLEVLISAFAEILERDRSCRLIIAGEPKRSADYWNEVEAMIRDRGIDDRVTQRIEYIPDEETELYFKAADVLILPYARVFQSGVLFLGYSFGLPAIAADVGGMKEEIIEGQTGFLFKAQDSSDLARKIRQYFASELFTQLDSRRRTIREYANERYSWDKVATIAASVYQSVTQEQ
jgi:glycosyltransferase involved in cell wall biosynthesis